MKKNLLKSSLITLSLLTLVSCNSTNVNFKKYKNVVSPSEFVTNYKVPEEKLFTHFEELEDYEYTYNSINEIKMSKSFIDNDKTKKGSIEENRKISIKFDNDTKSMKLSFSFETYSKGIFDSEYVKDATSSSKVNCEYLISEYEGNVIIADLSTKEYSIMEDYSSIFEVAELPDRAIDSEIFAIKEIETYDNTTLYSDKNVFTYVYKNESIIENEAINITTLEETIDQVVFKENELTWLAKTTSSVNSNYFIENVNTTKDNTNIIDVKLKFKKVSNKTIDLSKYTKTDEIELL